MSSNLWSSWFHKNESIFFLLRHSEQTKSQEFVIEIMLRSIKIIKNDVNMIYFEIQWKPGDLFDGRHHFFLRCDFWVWLTKATITSGSVVQVKQNSVKEIKLTLLFAIYAKLIKAGVNLCRQRPKGPQTWGQVCQLWGMWLNN